MENGVRGMLVSKFDQRFGGGFFLKASDIIYIILFDTLKK
jgi:hypothetical protein